MSDSDYNRIFPYISEEVKFITRLYETSYSDLISNSINILKLNFAIITAVVALFAFLYDGVPTIEEINILILTFGLLSWMVSSFLAGYVYSKTQYNRDSQIEVFFNHTKPNYSQNPISSHFIRHQFKLKSLSVYSSFCFILSIISAFLLVLSTLSTPPGMGIIIAIIAFLYIILVTYYLRL